MKSNRFGKCILAGITSALPAILSVVLPVVLPQAADAQISVSIGIPLPPPIVFAAPPELVVLPGSYVYVAADLAEDVYFVDGWWWRPWQGHWYRSHSYDRGWDRYSSVPSFYGGVNHGWRNDYRERRWQGHDWNYERMPQQRVASNWSSWKSNNYWDSHQHWGVPDMKQQSRSQAPAHASPRSASRDAQHSPDTRYRAESSSSHRAEHGAAGQVPAQRMEHGAGGSHPQNAAGGDHSQGHAGNVHGHGGQAQGHNGHSQGHSPGHGNGHE